MALIRFVGHASFAIEDGSTVLLADPWLEGTAFNDGWEMLAPASLTPDVRDRVTDVYVSHEHPDHFAPASLLQLGGPVRPRVRVQRTRDGRVAAFCRAHGFDVTELPEHERFTIGDGFDVVCGRHRHMDSWLLADVNGVTFLNVNDCSITDRAQALRVRSVTGPVDVLFTQFSYANWVGNPDERPRRHAYAHELLGYVRTQIEVLQPRWVVPFASFIRFCHEENAYLNDELPGLGAVVDFIRSETDAEPVALYPGDTWCPGDPHDNGAAISAYDACGAEARPLRTVTRRFSVAELAEKADQQVARLHDRQNRMGATRLLEAVGYLPPVRVRLADTGDTVELCAGRGLVRTARPPHVEMGSDSLAFALDNDFGAETLYVNGRYRVLAGPERLFFRHFYPAILNNQGYSFPLGAAQFLFEEKIAWRARTAREAFKGRRASEAKDADP